MQVRERFSGVWSWFRREPGVTAEKRARKELVQEKELLVLLLRMGQASGSWRRVSGGKESGKVSMPVAWRFFFLFGREEGGEAGSVAG